MGNNNCSPSPVCEVRQKSLQILEERALDKERKEDALQGPAKELSQEDIAASLVQIEDYEFPFENLIFEGGGNKGTSYVGCLQCLEDIGLVSQIKRFAGSSIGSITAALIALGYTSSEIDGYMSKNKEDMIFDHSFGYLSLLPNLLKDFGWNPGNGIYKWFGDMIQRKSAVGNPDMTFLDLYKERKKELCVVVTNVNQMREEYCHIKTTPNMPIRDALRMSMAIPGVFAAIFHQNNGERDIYVDGGVVCSYPLHCFDGWYLSMSPDDTFLQKIAPLSNLHNIMLERFREKNLKSLGFLLYDDSELEVIRFKLEKRVGSTEPQKPRVETKLYKQWLHKMKRSTNAMEEHGRVVEAFDAFMKALRKHSLVDKEFISEKDLADALQDKDVFHEEYSDLLFGPNISVDKAFQMLDKDSNGQISFIELVQFIEAHGIKMQAKFQGSRRTEVKNLSQFFSAVGNTLMSNLAYLFLKENDEDRTVGINTGHIQTLDYTLETADKEFVIQRGYNATKVFLQYYVVQNPQTKKKPRTDTINQPIKENEPQEVKQDPVTSL